MMWVSLTNSLENVWRRKKTCFGYYITIHHSGEELSSFPYLEEIRHFNRAINGFKIWQDLKDSPSGVGQ